MREIKFRAKSVENNKWVYGYYAGEVGMFPPSIITEDGKSVPIEKETLGQYITTNQDGYEIYEGDVVDYYGYKCLIEINPGKGIIVANVINYSDGFIRSCDWDNMKYLGNKHDYPELLEV